MTGFAIVFLTPIMCWMWWQEIVNLVSDCIAEGIRKSREP